MNPLAPILFIILPVLVAGITFIIILKFKLLDFLSYPLDLGLHYRRKRIFGNNKTLRGPLVMGLGASLYGLLLNMLLKNSLNLSEKEVVVNFFLIGLLYSLGELPNSFLKRQLGVPPGELPKNSKYKVLFKVSDIFDSLIFCGIGYAILFQFPVSLIVLSVLIGGILHIVTDKLMVSLSLKKKA